MQAYTSALHSVEVSFRIHYNKFNKLLRIVKSSVELFLLIQHKPL